jgi:ferrous iron transport protein A
MVETNKTTPLDHLAIGQSARVAQMDLKPVDAQRLMEMGLTVGTEVILVRRAPLRYPVVIQARGSQLSLRKLVAKSIRVHVSGQ